LHLTLTSLSKIAQNLSLEVIVVDNASNDGVLNYIVSDFPDVRYIENRENVGFAKANNLGVRSAKSDTILILNPDTIVSEEVIREAISYLYSEPKTGAVAVKMLDGRGDYLPESARRFPNIKSSFLKILGLKRHSNYYMTANAEQSIEVMSGACMFFKRDVYNEIEGLDERYFMYGEDIDISYQLHRAGYKIKLLEDNEIIHFKGRSSVKSNWRYQTAFYNAMKLYWQKNFQWGQQVFMNLILGCVLFGLKILSALRHGLGLIYFPIADFMGISIASSIFTYLWSVQVKHDVGFVPPRFYFQIIPIYTLLAIGSMLFAKFYLRDIDLSRLVKASIVNVILILGVYFVLPVDYKYSRAIIIYMGIISFFIPFLIRWLYARWTKTKLVFSDTRHLIASIFPNSANEKSLRELVASYSNFQILVSQDKPEAQIIDVEEISNQALISRIKESRLGIPVWIYSKKGNYLIQCHGKNSNGYVIAADENYTIYEWTNQLRKRIADLFLCIVALVLVSFSKHSFSYILKSISSVISGTHSWVGIKEKAIFPISSQLEENYQRNYRLTTDLNHFFRSMFIS
jgi:GT2 family glycosyltransferase